MTKWNRSVKDTTTNGLDQVRDLDYQYTGKLVRYSFDPFRGLPREHVWTDDAACGGINPELFQMSQGTDPGLEDLNNFEIRKFNEMKVKEALTYCASCPIKKRCLEESTDSDRHWSVRGGLEPTRLATTRVPTYDRDEWFGWECKVHKDTTVTKWRLRKSTGKVTPYCAWCEEG